MLRPRLATTTSLALAALLTVNVIADLGLAQLMAGRNLPLGLVSALVLTVLIYMGVSISAASVVPWQELAEAHAPLVEVVARAAPWFPAWMFIAITIFAVANTGLINYVTASRLLYGMARDGQLPRVLGKVHPARRTPHVAVALIFRADRAPDPVGGHFAAGFGYGAPPPPGVLGRKQCACHPEAQT